MCDIYSNWRNACLDIHQSKQFSEIKCCSKPISAYLNLTECDFDSELYLSVDQIYEFSGCNRTYGRCIKIFGAESTFSHALIRGFKCILQMTPFGTSLLVILVTTLVVVHLMHYRRRKHESTLSKSL